ncbi:M48 family metalloprotease [Acidianus sulfidivorans JP7]|uniref:Peptidase M48 domain-containing protein n=1 Tax=Acidianus sulfidivorans JP7 TaxID=619593 RepID=A0A2U9IND4_9CREN|nr:M48 family metalloprotease [Acidianus sulfidivorans]AWR97512.1 M48 family metalloprotease [Acidianus sulfidivorans JP7]
MNLITFALLSIAFIDIVYFALPYFMKYDKIIELSFSNLRIPVKIRNANYVNAFSLYNGSIILTSASLNLDNEEIYAMIAHELGHIRMHHHIKMLLLINILVFIMFININNIFVFIPIAISLILLQRYISRFFELQADSYAAKLVSKKALYNLIIKYGENKSSILSTHPSALTRIKKI